MVRNNSRREDRVDAMYTPYMGPEQRLVQRVLAHWREARGEALFPSLGAVLERPLGRDHAHLFMLKVPHGRGEPTFLRVGEALAANLGVPLLGRPVSVVPLGTLLAHAVEPFDLVLNKLVPVCLGGQFVDRACRAVLYRTVIMPVADEYAATLALLGAANGKFVTSESEGLREREALA